MSVFELLGMAGLAMVAASVVARLIDLYRHRGLIRIVGRPSHPASKTTFRDTYVSETTPAYFQYVRRRYRSAVHCPVRYFVNGQIGEGLVVDMTRQGWRVRGQGEVRLGMALSMDLTLPGVIGTVPVSRAVVCWVQGAEFGVKLEAVEPLPAAELSEFFSSLPQTAVFSSKAA